MYNAGPCGRYKYEICLLFSTSCISILWFSLGWWRHQVSVRGWWLTFFGAPMTPKLLLAQAQWIFANSRGDVFTYIHYSYTYARYTYMYMYAYICIRFMSSSWFLYSFVIFLASRLVVANNNCNGAAMASKARAKSKSSMWTSNCELQG